MAQTENVKEKEQIQNKNFLKEELERLTNDKAQTEATILNLEKELKRLTSQNDMLSGAIQTCQYFMSLGGDLRNPDGTYVSQNNNDNKPLESEINSIK
tara:strand:- start:1677 stop:1970 length:294 start_codon:yes stop_codon:yes gene_type:complete